MPLKVLKRQSMPLKVLERQSMPLKVLVVCSPPRSPLATRTYTSFAYLSYENLYCLCIPLPRLLAILVMQALEEAGQLLYHREALEEAGLPRGRSA